MLYELASNPQRVIEASVLKPGLLAQKSENVVLLEKALERSA